MIVIFFMVSQTWDHCKDNHFHFLLFMTVGHKNLYTCCWFQKFMLYRQSQTIYLQNITILGLLFCHYQVICQIISYNTSRTMTSLSKWYVCTKSCGQLYIEMVFIAEICSSKWLRISSCVQSMREVTRVHTEALWVAPFWWIICLVGVMCWPFLPRSEAFGGDLEDFKYAMSVLGMGWLLFLHWVTQSILATGLYIPLYDNMSQVFPYVFYSLITYRYCKIWSLPNWIWHDQPQRNKIYMRSNHTFQHTLPISLYNKYDKTINPKMAVLTHISYNTNVH